MFNRIYNDKNSKQLWSENVNQRNYDRLKSNNKVSGKNFESLESCSNLKTPHDSIQLPCSPNYLSFYFNKDPNVNNNHSSFYSITDKKQQRKNSFKFNYKSSETSTKSRSDDDFSDFTIDLYSKELKKLLSKKKIRHEAAKMILRNQQCLNLLIEGDIIEYVKKEDDIESKEYLKSWAIYMGNSMTMRFDAETKSVIYESYWHIADKNFIFINREYDKRWLVFPIYEILKRARVAHEKKIILRKLFSSDKNFVFWCRFGINTSELDVSTEPNDHSYKDAKEFLMDRFFNSFVQAEEKVKSQEEKAVKYKLTFLFHENKNRSKKTYKKDV